MVNLLVRTDALQSIYTDLMIIIFLKYQFAFIYQVMVII